MSALDIANFYIARGWSPIPVPHGKKSPTTRGWHNLIVTTDNLIEHFNADAGNIGVLLGPKSNGLTDVDLDCPEAITFATHFLPRTRAIFGRTSKRSSHHLYYVQDPPPVASIKLTDPEGRCIVELRIGGGAKAAQTVFPGSTHPSGETIEWDVDGDPAASSFSELDEAIKKIAVASILLRSFPAVGSRHDAALALGGFFGRAGWDIDKVGHFVEILAREAGSSDPIARAKDAQDAVRAHQEGRNVFGFPGLKEYFGEPAAVTIAKILNYGRDLPIGVNGLTFDDFVAYLPAHNYIFLMTREPWPAASVNSQFGKVHIGGGQGIDANKYLDKYRSVEQMVWAPGMPMLIHNKLAAEGGWIERSGVATINIYRPPTLPHGDASLAQPWLDHLRRIYPEEADHLTKWLAHRVQFPGEKINHGVVLGGNQGIGKDTMLEPVKRAIGPWNFIEVSPQQVSGRFNGFAKCVILRISEARDLGHDRDRFGFYEHMKVFMAAPPDVLRIDEKNLREYSIFNCCGVVITTNRKDSMYLPSDDRRHFVCWSTLSKEDFSPEYWKNLWDWYEHGGDGHVAAYLAGLNLTDFNPKSPPPKTAVFWQMVETNRTPEDAELADVLDKMERPDAVTIAQIANKARELGAQHVHDGDFFSFLTDRKNRRAIPHRMEECGYIPVRNEARKDGIWTVGESRQVIYANLQLTAQERYRAALELVRRAAQGPALSGGGLLARLGQ